MPSHFATTGRIIPPRAPFYTLTLISAIWQMFVSPVIVNNEGKSSDITSFSTACGLVAAFTWLFVAILIGHGRSDQSSEHLLTRSYVHIISFGLIAVLWLALGVFLATQTNIECRSHTGRCQPALFSTGLAFLISFSACLCIAIVICPVAASDVGYSAHVERAMDRARNPNRSRTPNRVSNGRDVNHVTVQRPPASHVL